MRMHRISRAPVLSATLSLVSFWITARPPECQRSGSLRALQDLDQPPALRARHRPALDDPHEVALVRVVALVVGVQRARGPDDLAVAPVALGDVDADGDRLVRLVGHDLAHTHGGRAGAVLGRRRALALRRLLRALLLPAAAAGGGLRLAHLEPLLGRRGAAGGRAGG